MRERHNVLNSGYFTRPVDIISARSDRGDPDGLGNVLTNHRIDDVSVQPKFERTYRYTRRKSIIRELIPNNDRSKDENLDFGKSEMNEFQGVKSTNGRDMSSNFGNVAELRKLPIMNNLDNSNQIIPINPRYDMSEMKCVQPIDKIFNRVDSRKSIIDDRNMDKISGNGCIMAMGDLYNGLESIGIAICKLISVTGQSCLKACQIIESYTVGENKSNGKIINNMGNYNISKVKNPSISNSYTSSEISRPLTLDERKLKRNAIENYLSGEKINIHCNFQMDLDNLNSTNKSSNTEVINNDISNDIESKLKGCNISIFNDKNVESMNGDVAIKDGELDKNKIQSGITLNNPLNKSKLPSFKIKKSDSMKKLVDRVEILELNKLAGKKESIMPEYVMEDDKSSKTTSVKTLEGEDNSVECKGGIIQNITISDINDEKKCKSKKLNKLRSHKSHRC